MTINNLLEQRSMSKYRLSKLSKVPFTTISEITTGKSNIKNCTGETLYKLARALDVSMEELLSDSMKYRMDFELYKSAVCHQVKDMGDMPFIIKTLESNEIRELYQKKWYAECFYLLAMVDYLSRENDLPRCNRYDDLREGKLTTLLYPAGVITKAAVFKSEAPKEESLKKAIPEFLKFNIVESEVRNVI